MQQTANSQVVLLVHIETSWRLSNQLSHIQIYTYVHIYKYMSVKDDLVIFVYTSIFNFSLNATQLHLKVLLT